MWPSMSVCLVCENSIYIFKPLLANTPYILFSPICCVGEIIFPSFWLIDKLIMFKFSSFKFLTEQVDLVNSQSLNCS